MNKKNGFTLVELLAMLTVLGILMVVTIPNISKILNNNRVNKYKMDAKKICICCSKCTQIMRCPGGTPGCVIRDSEVYKPLYDKLVRGV